jgi:hypothetical protein
MVPETNGAGSVTTGALMGASPLPPKLAQAARVEKAARIIAPFNNLAHITFCTPADRKSERD